MAATGVGFGEGWLLCGIESSLCGCARHWAAFGGAAGVLWPDGTRACGEYGTDGASLGEHDQPHAVGTGARRGGDGEQIAANLTGFTERPQCTDYAGVVEGPAVVLAGANFRAGLGIDQGGIDLDVS